MERAFEPQDTADRAVVIGALRLKGSQEPGMTLRQPEPGRPESWKAVGMVSLTAKLSSPWSSRGIFRLCAAAAASPGCRDSESVWAPSVVCGEWGCSAAKFRPDAGISSCTWRTTGFQQNTDQRKKRIPEQERRMPPGMEDRREIFRLSGGTADRSSLYCTPAKACGVSRLGKSNTEHLNQVLKEREKPGGGERMVFRC